MGHKKISSLYIRKKNDIIYHINNGTPKIFSYNPPLTGIFLCMPGLPIHHGGDAQVSVGREDWVVIPGPQRIVQGLGPLHVEWGGEGGEGGVEGAVRGKGALA